jgi:sugar lactone lactonase YvrE
MAEILSSPLDVLASGFAYAEDPRWRNGRLYFSDMYGGKVHAVDLSGTVETILDLGDGTPSGLGFMPNGDLLVVSMFERVLLRLGTSGITRHADLSALAPHSINDMVVDHAGRAYVGQSGFDYWAGEAPRPAPLIAVEPDGSIGVAAPDLMVGNGVVITDDGRTLIVAETLGHRISAFDIDEAGRLSNRRVFATLPDNHMPDGICLDTEGGIWTACPSGLGVARFEDGGRITHIVPLPEPHRAYACMLGGADRRTLFICSSETSDKMEAPRRRSSRILALPVGFTGAGLP